LTVPFTYILEWHVLAHAGTCFPFLLFSWTRTFCRKLVHACADYYYQLPDDIIVIALIFTPPPLDKRRALFDVRRWRRVLCCYFCDGCCAEWERGYSYGYGKPLCCDHYAVTAILARKPLRASRRCWYWCWWRWQRGRSWCRWLITLLFFSEPTVATFATTT
jgi:hypothetical protein